MGYVLAAIVGAILAGGAQIVLELFKRRDDRRGIASAIAGEISGILYGEAIQGMADHFQHLAVLLRAGTAPPPPWLIYDKDYKITPVLDAYMNRIGALGGRLPERVARFYTLHGAVIIAEKILASGFYDQNPSGAADHIERALKVWAEAKAEAGTLISDLHALSGVAPEA